MGRDVASNKNNNWSTSTTTTPFTFLSLEIPPTPLFRDSEGGLIIPQIPLFKILQKFDGQTWVDKISVNSHIRKKYIIRKLPKFLILHLVRFTKNNFLNLEKNRSVVTFPVKNLSLKDFYFPLNENNSSTSSSSSSSSPSSDTASSSSTTANQPPKKEDVVNYSVGELKSTIKQWGCETHVNEMNSIIGESESTLMSICYMHIAILLFSPFFWHFYSLL